MRRFHLAIIITCIGIMAISTLVSCDRDFATIDSDIIGDDTFNFDTSKDDIDVRAYNRSFASNAVQTNTLPYNLLGYVYDPVFGGTRGGFVSQITPTTYSPTFGENVEIDSVVLSIPYFSTVTGTDEEGNLYRLDSIFGSDPINISIYENAYFLRNSDPFGDEIDTPQKYYSDASDGYSPIPTELLESVKIYDTVNFLPQNKQIRFRDSVGDVASTLKPAFRVQLDTTYWKEKIIAKEGDPVLSNASNFRKYFRGLYFKAEPIDGKGSLIGFNLGDPETSITIYFKKDSTVDGANKVSATYGFTFSGNKFNMFNPIEVPIPSDETNGDERLYLKGGQGSMAVIELFGGENEDEDPNLNEFETYRRYFSEVDENGKFVKAKKLINEANLIFYVDQDIDQTLIADRIYIYNLKENLPLTDMTFDLSNGNTPLNYHSVHLGALEREGDEIDGMGIRYKLIITDYIKSLLLGDAENVKLGVTVSGNIRVENIYETNNSLAKTPADVLNDSDNGGLPISSIITPRNAVLHGSTESNGVKKLKLEIYYTNPNLE